MKNILSEPPQTDLHGRLLASVQLVPDSDIANKSILDIGCGYGWCIINFLSRNAQHINATEHTQDAIQTAQSAIQDERVSFTISPATSLPFPDESFDTIVCWEVLEHIPKGTEEQMYSEVFRVLKPGGSFYLSTPYNSLWSKILDPAWWLADHRHYSATKLTKFGNDAGLTVNAIHIRGRAWHALAGLNMYCTKWIFRRRPFFESLMNRKTDAEYLRTGYIDIFATYSKTTIPLPQKEEAYIYNSWHRLLLRSIQLDIEWMHEKKIPDKWLFLGKKYLFLMATPLFWNTLAKAYAIGVWDRTIFMESRNQVGIIQSTLINHTYLRNCIRTGAIIIDIGAHTGEFALMCEVILQASRVYSFEPIEQSYKLLARNKREDIYNVAIDTATERTMYIPHQTAMASGYATSPGQKPQLVQSMELDSVPAIQKLSHIDLIKIDVEGMEYDVLAASKKTLTKARYILMEVSIDRPATKPALQTLEYFHRIAPTFELIHAGQVFGSPTRTDSVDFLFRNTAKPLPL